jgi:hypothetical protein
VEEPGTAAHEHGDSRPGPRSVGSCRPGVAGYLTGDNTAHDDADRGPDRPAAEADFRPALGVIARAGEVACQAGAVVDGRLGLIG